MFCFICALRCAVAVEDTVQLEFLGNQTSLSNDSSVFAFFGCNVFDGPNLSWEIYGEGIGVFGIDDDLDRVIARNRSDYGYIATVLSRRGNSSRLNFSSVLMVLLSNGSSVEVNCVSNGDHASISNLETPHLGHDINGEPRGSNFLYMLPVLNSTIIMGESTRAFICASIGQNQLWTTDINDYIGFDTNSNYFGSHRSKSYLNSLRLQAISLGQQYQHLVSILYLTDDAVSSVKCSANGNMVEYPHDFITVPSGM